MRETGLWRKDRRRASAGGGGDQIIRMSAMPVLYGIVGDADLYIGLFGAARPMADDELVCLAAFFVVPDLFLVLNVLSIRPLFLD